MFLVTLLRANHTISWNPVSGQVEILSSFSYPEICDTIYSEGGGDYVLSAVITVHSDPVYVCPAAERKS